MEDEFSFTNKVPEHIVKKEPKNDVFVEVDDSFLNENSQNAENIDNAVSPDNNLNNEFQNINNFPVNQDTNQPLTLPVLEGNNHSSYLSLVLTPDLRDLELMIRGLEYVKIVNPKTGKEEVVLRKIKGHPLNEYGINQILTYIKLYVSPEIKLGRKREKDYYNAIQQVSKTITRLIYKNLKKFGMDTQEKQRHAKPLCLSIIELIDAAYSRSIEGKENDLSRATEFKVEGSLDAFNRPLRILNPELREQLKN